MFTFNLYDLYRDLYLTPYLAVIGLFAPFLWVGVLDIFFIRRLDLAATTVNQKRGQSSRSNSKVNDIFIIKYFKTDFESLSSRQKNQLYL